MNELALRGNEDLSGASDDGMLVDMWLATHRSPHTRRAYKHDVGGLQAYMQEQGVTLRSVSVRHLLTWAAGLKGGEATRARGVGAVKSLFAFAARVGYCPFDIGAVVQVPRVPNQLAERIMDEESVRKVWTAAQHPRDRVFVRFLYVTGARVSEACGLEWRHVHPMVSGDSAVTLHGKGGKTRTVLLPAVVSDELHALRGNSSHDVTRPVFMTQSGDPVTPGGMRSVLRTICKRAGMPGVTPHWFRHAHASHALDHGAPASLVQAQLGHASLATTGAYTHARPTDGSGKYLDLKDEA